MDSQIKKGSLELCILMLLQSKDCYGYELSKEIGSQLQVKEGTIYLILQRLEKTLLVESYLCSSPTAKQRKYYKLTNDGIIRMQKLIDDYNQINIVITNYKKLLKKEKFDE